MAPAPMMMTDEYLHTPETVRPQELIYGVLRRVDALTPRHHSAVLAFALELAGFVREHALGRIYISPIDVDGVSGLVLTLLGRPPRAAMSSATAG